MLQLSLFGSLQATADGQPIPQFPTDKIRALLAYLAIEGTRPLRRETLATLLWPDWDDTSAKRNLRQSLHRLRLPLDTAVPGLSDQLLHISRQTIHINPTHLWLDVAQFQTLLEQIETHTHRQLHQCPTCMAKLRQAAELSRRGSFMADFHLADAPYFEEWLIIQRERFHVQQLHLLGTLAQAHLWRGEFEPATTYATQQIALEPWREEAHQQMLAGLMGQGRRAEAMEQYHLYRQWLADELGLVPSAEMTRLYDDIRTGTAVLRPITPSPLYQFPTYFTPFFGRQEALADIGRRLAPPHGRILTLLGAGGMGKTRLAIAAATQLAQQGHWPAGVYFVPLAEATTPTAAQLAIAQAVGLSLAAVVELASGLAHFLQGKQVLLVLDNYEQLVEQTAWLADLATAVPTLTLLITSREPLHLPEEQLLGLGGLAEAPARQLFAQLAQRIQPDFDAQEQEEAIGRLVHLVGGMPLALEIAASWVRLLPCAQIATQIETGLDVLVSTWQDMPDRHQSIRAVFEQAWQMLPPASQQLWATLGLFSGGFTAEAAVAIAHTTPLALDELVLRSLVRQSKGGRYEMHPLVRQFALGKMAPSADVYQRYSAYYLGQLGEHERDFYGVRAAEVYGRFLPEQDNIQQAWRWAAEQGEMALLRLSQRAFGRFVRQAGLYQQGISLLEEAIQQLARRPNEAETAETIAQLRYRQAILAIELKQYEPAARQLQAALAHWQATADGVRQSGALANLGIIAWRQGDFATAEAQLQASLALAQAHHHDEMVAYIWQHMGNLAWVQGDVPQAKAYLQQSLPLYRAQGNLYRLAGNLNDLGAAAGLTQVERELSQAYFEEALALYQQLGHRLGATLPQSNLGYMALGQGQYARARQLFEGVREVQERFGVQADLAGTWVNLGMVALQEPTAEGERAGVARAAMYLGQALKLAIVIPEQQVVVDGLMVLVGLAVRQQNWQAAVRLAAGLETHFVLLEGLEMKIYTSAVAELRSQLPPAEFEALWLEGRLLTQTALVQLGQMLVTIGTVH